MKIIFSQCATPNVVIFRREDTSTKQLTRIFGFLVQNFFPYVQRFSRICPSMLVGMEANCTNHSKAHERIELIYPIFAVDVLVGPCGHHLERGQQLREKRRSSFQIKNLIDFDDNSLQSPRLYINRISCDIDHVLTIDSFIHHRKRIDYYLIHLFQPFQI